MTKANFTDSESEDQENGTGLSKIPIGANALAKGLNLLNLVADADTPLRFSELYRQSGLPKPTFARILRTLVAFELVRQDETRGAYVLGPRFMHLSNKVWESFDVKSFAAPELRALSTDLGETVALCQLDGNKVHYIEEQSGIGLSVRIEPGRRVPLHATAAGKVLLAFQDPAVTRSLLQSLILEKFTDNTITTVEKLQAELTLTRARGYAISFEEHLPGVNSVAVGIAGRDGFPIGALSVLGPSSRMTETSIHPIGRELIAASRRITGSAGAVAISSQPRPRSKKTNTALDLTCVLPWGAQLGESPVWHPVEKVLYWIDILKPALYRFNPRTGRNEVRELGKLVSAVLPAQDGRLLLATQDGIEWFDFDNATLEPFANPEAGLVDNRLNDAKVGPDGAIWIGSMRIDASRPSGALYRVLRDGSFEQKEAGLAVSNGLDWSPDEKKLYFIDTIPRTVYVYETSPNSGSLSNKQVFATVPESEGRPGGITVDAEGGVWVAIWDGWRINRYLPDGRLDRSIDLPVPRPTSLAFGGDKLDTLYITSARTRLPANTLNEASLSGGLFTCVPGVRGRPCNLFPHSLKTKTDY